MYKSDVFSCGLIMMQFATMEDVTGFNQKNQANDGEALIDSAIKHLRTRYNDHVLKIIKLMLRFNEAERPSFTELAKLVLTDQSVTSTPKDLYARKGPKKEAMSVSVQNNSKLGRHSDSNPTTQTQQLEEDSQANLMTQSELFKAYSDQNHLYLNLTNNMLWFEFGGSKIGRLQLEGENSDYSAWRLVAKYKGEFSCHFTTVFVNGGAQGLRPITEEVNKNVGSWFLLGGVGNNCL